MFRDIIRLANSFPFLLIVTVYSLNAQAFVESDIKYIRSDFNRINQLTHLMAPEHIDLPDMGAGVQVYKTGGRLIKLVAHYPAEKEKSVREYYFDGHGLFFAFISNHIYKHPVDWHKRKDYQNNNSSGLAEDKPEISENRYYFKDDKLIRWLDPNKKDVSPSAKSFDQAHIEIWEEVYALVEMLDRSK
ncbi:hypothetical protein QQ020_25090 [Fulvivirgaceae bacterium BMA12]|uniref:Uncharacterized protein n=1 Tax=Agaribacillus aureus TaxID=3051825 RepID=A0ABT8LC81_9BACT|nr:hypothetical protein [Fulvivirgaceae bacterium BMA12]